MTTKIPNGAVVLTNGKGYSEYSNGDIKTDDSFCYCCKVKFKKKCNTVQCDVCKCWYHSDCAVSPKTFKEFAKDKRRKFVCYWNKCTTWLEFKGHW